MKLSQLHPCDNCGGKIGPQFYVIRASLAFIKPVSLQQHLGLTMMMGGSVALAEIFAPDDDVAVVAGDQEPVLMSEIILCQDCAMMKEHNIIMLMEKAASRELRGSNAKPNGPEKHDDWPEEVQGVDPGNIDNED